MSNGRVISSAEDIDLTRHGVIEAHAGTGKTYTIVNLVLRMLEQTEKRGKRGDDEYVHLRKILLVTYTEKAAGELKKRIREGIAARINELHADTKNRNLVAHLKNCLNNMHEAFIGTIHSVCLRLLQTWPFETGVHFNTAMVEDDAEGAEAALRTSMRTDWEDMNSGLPQGIKAMKDKGVRLESNHISLITKTALEIIRGDGSELDTAQSGGLTLKEAVDQINNAAEAELDALRQKLRYAFINRAAEILAEKYVVYKRKKGLVSYDDMLRLMRNAVYSKDGVMLKRLRQRLRYGIIDEFQDTSPLQWDIFRKIFLGDESGAESSISGDVIDTSADTSTQTRGKARIYIVGDPKQSIYSFQGADINSYVSAKNAISPSGETIYSLRNNFRSSPEMINGYNSILCGGAKDWFDFDDGDISYPASDAAHPPQRDGVAPRPLTVGAVQVVKLDTDSEPDNRRVMADAACAAIKKLVGTTVSVPKGLHWEELTLDYGDFAVIIETHIMTDPFIEAFRKNGIPCVKYKMAGVFKSAIARDLIALLTAIHKRHSRPHRLAALLTHFFNREAGSITSKSDTDYCPNPYCSGNNLCVAHAIDFWGKLADRQLWAQLFKSVIERTAVRRRLIRLIDGERKLADLRQVTDYCVERLYSQNTGLDRLIKHLERLYDGEEEASGDKNIHTLATEKSSVKILTMHAAKGLEFPIVFLMNRDSAGTPNGPNVLRWADANKNRRFTPYISVNDLRDGKGKNKKDRESLTRYNESLGRERRRLLYVAMTRPQAMLFVPMRDGEADKADNDITPRLNELLERGDNPNIEIFDGKNFDKSIPAISTDKKDTQSIRLDDIPELSLHKFISVETSYSQISRELKAASVHNNDISELITTDDDGEDVIRNDEYHIEDIDVDTDTDIGTNTDIINTDININVNKGIDTKHINTNTNKNQPLIGGKTTGDALHKAIDELMRSDDINAIINDNNGALDKIVEKYLKRGGILDHKSTTDPAAAIKQASSYIKTALTLPYPIPNGAGTVTLSDLPKSDRVSEMEFLLSCDSIKDEINPLLSTAGRRANAVITDAPYRIHGFIDLVFRLKNENCPRHPYRYYIIDWKSDTLENYGQESLHKYCVEQNYTLQSQLYTIALDKYLSGVLGNQYDKKQHLGGSLYVFLRGGAGAFLAL